MYGQDMQPNCLHCASRLSCRGRELKRHVTCIRQLLAYAAVSSRNRLWLAAISYRWVEVLVPPVQGDKQHPVVIVEDLLSAVAVVDLHMVCTQRANT